MKTVSYIAVLFLFIMLFGCNGGGDGATSSNGNRPPIANAGADQVVTAGEQVVLSGAGSSDPDGNPLSYVWSITSSPAGSTSAISNATSTTAYLTPDLAGSYMVQLVVNDGTVSSVADTMMVSVGVNNALKIYPPSSSVEYRDSNNDGVNEAKYIYTYTYNSDGRPSTSLIESVDLPETSASYRSWQRSIFTYKVDGSVEEAVEYKEGVAGDLHPAGDGSWTYIYKFNGKNQLVSVEVSGWSKTTYSYNEKGQCLLVQIQNGRDSFDTTYTYNNQGQLAVENGYGSTKTYSYNTDGQLKSVVADHTNYSQKDILTYSYDASGRLVSKVTEVDKDKNSSIDSKSTTDYTINSNVKYLPLFLPAGSSHHEFDVTNF